MYCPRCGHENPDEAKFCNDCGGDLSGVRHASSRPSRPSHPETPSDAFRRWSKLNKPVGQSGGKAVKLGGVFVVILSLVLVGVFVAVCYANDDSGSPSSNVGGTEAAAPDPTIGEWVEVAFLSGTESVGDVFTLTGNKARLTYTITDVNVLPVMTIYLMEDGKYLDRDGGIPEAMPDESGETTIMKPPGS